ncbi:MAG: cytochrome c oxidase subunit II [Gammaproteobacteria bacterium]
MSIHKHLAAAAALAGLAFSAVATGHPESTLNLPVGVTPIAQQAYHLHMLILWVCVAIAVVVFGAMIYSLVKYRKSKGAVADTSIVRSTKAEIIWTIIPVVILVAMAVPATKGLIIIEDSRNSGLTIKTTGYQWKWQYEYVSQNVDGTERDITGVGFFSSLDEQSNFARQLDSGTDPASVPDYLLNVDNPLVIPSGVKVRVLLTANDVIHAWWVPQFGMKRDAIPGFVNELWIQVDEGKEGIYRGQCVELCGRDHGFMPVVVEVKTKKDFDAWLTERQQAAATAANATKTASL